MKKDYKITIDLAVDHEFTLMLDYEDTPIDEENEGEAIELLHKHAMKVLIADLIGDYSDWVTIEPID